MVEPPADALRSPDGSQWWDGSSWQPFSPATPAIPADAVRSPDGSQWWDGAEWEPIPKSEPPQTEASAIIEYPVVLHWRFGTLTATPTGVAFDMTAKSLVFGRNKGIIHREFAYADLRDVTVHRDSDVGVVLHTKENDTQGCQGCNNADEVSAFLAVLKRHGVDVADGSATDIAAAGAVTPARRSQVKVKSYKNEKEFERDATKMMRDGWEIEAQSSKDRKTAIGRTAGKAVLTGGVGLILMGRSKKGDTITVTWMK
jgi:hypothetical protein